VPNPLFQKESIFQPALAACVTGLLTVIYDFLIFSKYYWNIAAFLTLVAAGLSSVVYAGLLMWTRRKITAIAKAARGDQSMSVPLTVPLNMTAHSTPGLNRNNTDTESAFQWQDTAYYDNYARNMFPSALPPDSNPSGRAVFDPHAVPEEELQRQQMLNLLLQREQEQLSPPLPSQNNSTYRIDIPVPNDTDSANDAQSGRQFVSPGGPSPLTAHSRPAAGTVQPWNDDVMREVDRRR
jgi:hypothetical protein